MVTNLTFRDDTKVIGYDGLIDEESGALSKAETQKREDKIQWLLQRKQVRNVPLSIS